MASAARPADGGLQRCLIVAALCSGGKRRRVHRCLECAAQIAGIEKVDGDAENEAQWKQGQRKGYADISSCCSPNRCNEAHLIPRWLLFPHRFLVELICLPRKGQRRRWLAIR